MQQALYPKHRFPARPRAFVKTPQNMGSVLRDAAAYAERDGISSSAGDARGPHQRTSFRRDTPTWSAAWATWDYSSRTWGLLLSACLFRAGTGDVSGDSHREPFPLGHPDIAVTLDNLGELLRAERLSRGEEVLRFKRWRRSRPLYPRDQYPQGHRDLGKSLSNLGSLLQEQGEYGEAR